MKSIFTQKAVYVQPSIDVILVESEGEFLAGSGGVSANTGSESTGPVFGGSSVTTTNLFAVPASTSHTSSLLEDETEQEAQQ